MTDRNVVIRLRGDIADFQAKMVAAGRSVSATTDKMTSAEKQSQKFRNGLSKVGGAAGAMGLAAAAGLGVVIAATAKFDSAMSKVQAATHETEGNMKLLRHAAIQAGADTVFSATEAADAITAMSKAGVSTKDILAGGLAGALSLASAGELDVAQSAEIAATAMTQFALSGSDIPHIADLLAAGAGKAQGEVTDFAQALKYVGPVAHQMGISIEETTGVIAELASQGILADQAGTSLRGMLTSLTSPSKIAATEMKNLGIQLYDANGLFVGFDGVAQQLHSTMGDLTNAERDQALGRIFGNEQITAARILYSGGAADVDKWTKAVNDQGYAAETAAIKMDNLKGDLEQLKGSLETALIGAGEGSQGSLRGLVQGATDAVNAFSDLPEPVQGATTKLLALVAVTGGAAWFGAKVIGGIASARVALTELGLTAVQTRTALLGVAKAGGVLAAAFAADWAFEQSNANLTMTDYINNLHEMADTGQATAALNNLGFSVDSLGEKLKRAAYTDFGNLFHQKDDVNDMDAALSHMATGPASKAFEIISTEGAKAGLTLKEINDLFPQYVAAAAKARKEADLNTVAQRSSGRALDETGSMLHRAGDAFGTAAGKVHTLGAAMDDTTGEAYTLKNAMDILFGNALSADAAMVEWRRSIVKLKSELEGGTGALDAFTKKGQDNRDAIRGQIESLRSWAEAEHEKTGSIKGLETRILKGRDAIIRQAEAAGIGRKEMEAYLRELGFTPKEIRTDVHLLGTDDAKNNAKDVGNELDDLGKKHPKPKVDVDVGQALSGIDAVRNGLLTLHDRTIKVRTEHMDVRIGGPKVATGGLLTGPGTGTSDSIPAWLSNGEYVVKAAAVDRYGVDMLHRINAMRFADGGYNNRGRAERVQTTRATNATVINNHGSSMPSAFTLVVDGRPMRAYVAEVAGDEFASRDSYARTTRGHR